MIKLNCPLLMRMRCKTFGRYLKCSITSIRNRQLYINLEGTKSNDMEQFFIQIKEKLPLTGEIYQDTHNQKLLFLFFRECYGLINQASINKLQDTSSTTIHTLIQQLTILFNKKLNKPNRFKVLRDELHRKMIIQLLKTEGIQYYSYSYFNQAKITEKHLRYLKEIGPYLFVEAIMLVSKLNVINKNYSRILTQDCLYNYQIEENEGNTRFKKIQQSHIDLKIKRILKLCDDKKRSINNNLNKLEALLDDQCDRVELIKELGKILRNSWKKQKSIKKTDAIQLEQVKPRVDKINDEKSGKLMSIQKREGLIELRQQNSELEEQYLRQKMLIIAEEEQEINYSLLKIGELQIQRSCEMQLLSVKSISLNSSLWDSPSYLPDFI